MNICTHRTFRHTYSSLGICLLALVMLGLASPAVASETLSYADRTPGQQRMADGHSAYRARQYSTALQHYRRAAYWADKFGHYNVGVMYYHGKGTEQDVPRAWAWFELAAEREYPQMRELAELLWDRLDAEQQHEAKRILENELLETYGDEAAIARTMRRMNRERRRVTGSRVGHVGNLKVLEVEGGVRFDENALGITIYYTGHQTDGNAFYNRADWDFNKVIETESKLVSALHGGNVSIRDFELVEDEVDTD